MQLCLFTILFYFRVNKYLYSNTRILVFNITIQIYNESWYIFIYTHISSQNGSTDIKKCNLNLKNTQSIKNLEHNII